MRTCSGIALLLLTLLPFGIDAQPRRNCGTMEHHQELVEEDPGYEERLQQIENFTRMRAKTGKPSHTLIRIPVVVHVVYHDPRENISDVQVESQIEALNRDFRRKNTDANTIDPRFQKFATDSEIEFVLANTDPYGNPTNGITRTYTPKVSFAAFTDEVKKSFTGGTNAWPASNYLNIWVCNLDMGVLGFAQFPGGRRETDGVVIGYKFFGTEGQVTAPFNLGRTTTHEIGHWLNLRHIWGDTPCGDDGVADTYPSDGPHHGCVSQASSCGSPDMVQNFMDYTDDACMNFFTHGQRQRMRALFSPGGARHSILSSRGYQVSEPIVCAPPFALHVNAITASTARLNWQAMQQAGEFELRMRRLPDGDWKSRTYSDTQADVVRLYPCSEYEFTVRSLCDNDVSNRPPATQFFTTGCGNTKPSNLVSHAVSSRQAVISWEPVAKAEKYEVQYIRERSRTKKRVVAANTRILIGGLLPGQNYYVRVRAILGGDMSEFSEIDKFRTPGRSNIPTAKTRN